MKALVFETIERPVIREIADPEPSAGEILVKVAVTGICHTDIDILHGRYLAAYPVVPGHEFAGIVEATGAGVDPSILGARVAIDPLLPCGICPMCQDRRFNLCTALAAYGATHNGAFAPYVVVRAQNAHAIGDLPFEIAALAEPFSCVLHGVAQARRLATQRCLIFGAGPIGLMMLLALQGDGIRDITIVDPLASRRETAVMLGAAGVVDSADLTPEMPGDRFDLVVDCTGSLAVCQTLPGYCCSGGTILLFGVCPPGGTMAVSPNEIFRRELRIVGSHSLCGELPLALDRLRQLGDLAYSLISHRMTLDGIAAYFSGERPQRTMKVQYQADQ